MRVSYVARKTLPIARQKQHFSLVTFLGSEQTPFVQTHCIYTSPSHAEHVPWKSGRASSWCVHAHCASPEGKKSPKFSPSCFEGAAASAGWSHTSSIGDVLGRLTEILSVGAHTSRFPKACSHTSSRGLVVWLRAVVTDSRKATRRREFVHILLCQQSRAPAFVLLSHKKIKPCTFARCRTLHLKGS